MKMSNQKIKDLKDFLAEDNKTKNTDQRDQERRLMSQQTNPNTDTDPTVLNGMGMDPNNLDLLTTNTDEQDGYEVQPEFLRKMWYRGDKDKISMSLPSVCDVLVHLEFGRLNGGDLIRRNGSILEIHTIESLSTYIWELFHNTSEKDFQDPKLLGVIKSETDNENGSVDIEYFSKREVENAIMKFGWITQQQLIYLGNFFDDLNAKKKSRRKFKMTDHTPIGRDNNNEVKQYFRNGIVSITKEGIDLKPLDSSIEDGYVWESKFKDQIDDIKIQSKKEVFNGNWKDGTNGVFKDFVEKCMSHKVDGKWVIDEKEYESFRTVYGYMLSNYTNFGQTPAPLFVDRDTDGKHAEGGNGKSLVMGSIEQWKKTLSINGKNINKDNQFLFSGVSADTEFIFLDDVGDDFDFKIIYNYTTSDMEIEKKFKDRFVIPKETKPKIGVATNYILSDTDFSTSRRQYIVEFGSFWHDMTKYKETSVQGYYDRRLFDCGWTEQDWIDFFNFGFQCISEYLFKGVIQNDHSNYKRKQVVAKIEGFGTNDGVVEYITKSIRDNISLGNGSIQTKGISLEDFYTEFEKTFDDHVIENWDQTRFNQAIWKTCHEYKWIYNPHKTGKTLSQKRWLVGKRNQQKPFVKIGNVG